MSRKYRGESASFPDQEPEGADILSEKTPEELFEDFDGYVSAMARAYSGTQDKSWLEDEFRGEKFLALPEEVQKSLRDKWLEDRPGETGADGADGENDGDYGGEMGQALADLAKQAELASEATRKTPAPGGGEKDRRGEHEDSKEGGEEGAADRPRYWNLEEEAAKSRPRTRLFDGYDLSVGRDGEVTFTERGYVFDSRKGQYDKLNRPPAADIALPESIRERISDPEVKKLVLDRMDRTRLFLADNVNLYFDRRKSEEGDGLIPKWSYRLKEGGEKTDRHLEVAERDWGDGKGVRRIENPFVVPRDIMELVTDCLSKSGGNQHDTGYRKDPKYRKWYGMMIQSARDSMVSQMLEDLGGEMAQIPKPAGQENTEQNIDSVGIGGNEGKVEPVSSISQNGEIPERDASVSVREGQEGDFTPERLERDAKPLLNVILPAMRQIYGSDIRMVMRMTAESVTGGLSEQYVREGKMGRKDREGFEKRHVGEVITLVARELRPEIQSHKMALEIAEKSNLGVHEDLVDVLAGALTQALKERPEWGETASLDRRGNLTAKDDLERLKKGLADRYRRLVEGKA
ncbi:hypothetical protein JW899_05030 [Candidatus Uhrbacteria bacterium]|nr:hypothetical protein [Candidatus Uhrbacteria bacterium]